MVDEIYGGRTGETSTQKFQNEPLSLRDSNYSKIYFKFKSPMKTGCYGGRPKRGSITKNTLFVAINRKLKGLQQSIDVISRALSELGPSPR